MSLSVSIKNLLTGGFSFVEEPPNEDAGKDGYVHTTEGEVCVDVDNYASSEAAASSALLSEIDEDDEEDPSQSIEIAEEEFTKVEPKEEIKTKGGEEDKDKVNTTIDTVKSVDVEDVAVASPKSIKKAPEQDVQEVDEQNDSLRKIGYGAGYLGALVIIIVLIAALTGRNRRKDELVPGMMCSDAMTIESVDGPTLIDGSTKKETDPGEVTDFGFCGMASPTGPGKWYKFVGNDSVYMASTCFDTTDFDTQISIFSGSCDGLSCVTANDNYCGDKAQVTWFAEAGIEYFVYVHGFRSQVGTFELLVEPVKDLNDKCSASKQIQSSNQIYGATQTLMGIDGAGNSNHTVGNENNETLRAGHENHPSCVADTASPGLWYSWAGTGRSVAFSTCNEGTDYEGAHLSVFTSSIFSETCEDTLECVEDVIVSDDCDGFGHSVQFVSEPKVRYYILVHGGEELNGGNFELSIQKSSFENRDFEACEGSKMLYPESDSVPEVETLRPDTLHKGDGMASPVFDGACGDSMLDASSPSVWYTVKGTGKAMTASTCDPVTAFDTQVTILSGNCTDLQCVTGNDQASCGDKASATWETSEDKMYHVVVHGFGARWGTFALRLEEDRLESN